MHPACDQKDLWPIWEVHILSWLLVNWKICKIFHVFILPTINVLSPIQRGIPTCWPFPVRLDLWRVEAVNSCALKMKGVKVGQGVEMYWVAFERFVQNKFDQFCWSYCFDTSDFSKHETRLERYSATSPGSYTCILVYMYNNVLQIKHRLVFKSKTLETLEPSMLSCALIWIQKGSGMHHVLYV